MTARPFEGEKEIDLLIRILNYAVRKRALPYNPASAVKSELRGRQGMRSRAILPREVVHPETVERIRHHMGGGGLQRDRYRLLVSVLAYLGLRPSEALALRWDDVLESPGPLRRHVRVDSAVKDIAGRLEEGKTKTGESRDVLLWPVVGEEFLELYTVAGEPALGEVVFANSRGGFMSFGNWRSAHWYPVLHRAGLAAAPEARAAG